MTCQQQYQQRLEARQQALLKLRQEDDRAANFRVASFLVGLLCFWAVFGSWQLSAWILLLPAILFVFAVLHHQRVRQKIRDGEKSIEHYRCCLARLEGKWIDFEASGTEHVQADHPYADDLDIFGKGSLYQFLGGPITPAGSQTLAAWLTPSSKSSFPTKEIIVRRQQAVQNLRDHLDQREQLAVIGPPSPAEGDVSKIHAWFSQSGGLNASWVRGVGMLLAAAGTGSLVLWFAGYGTAPLMVTILVQLAYVYRLRQPLGSIKKYSEKSVEELRRIVQVVAALEQLEGDDAELTRLRAELNHDGTAASKTIGELQNYVSQFENMRRNLFFAPLAFVTMTFLHFACAIDRWRSKHGDHVQRWLQAIGELEALLAFGQLHFENPQYSFPSLTDEGPLLRAEELAHPLLPPGTAIANDVLLDDSCRLLLVSGSNMSGKSTLMRSVGINTVLAWAGAPVYAKSLVISPLQVASAMRMQDSLQSGTSHFYAELKRIRVVVGLAEQAGQDTPPVLFLLDEILHGTNSHDRLVGARGVIKSLLEAGALGIVSTHDLALSDMVEDLSQPARNVHFCDDWRDGKMVFDYRMRDGVVPKSNALSLMRLLGLEV